MAELTEFFNLSLSHYEAHINYINFPKLPECGYVLHIPLEERCIFVNETASCSDSVHSFHYMDFVFCQLQVFKHFYIIPALILFGLWIGILLSLVEVLAEKFFVPVVLVISHLFRINEHLAGQTILAYSTSVSDIFLLAFKYSGDLQMRYNQIMGCLIFIHGVVAASVIYMHPFSVVGSFFIRDSMVLLIAIIWVHITTAYYEEIPFNEGIAFIIFYGVYFLHGVLGNIYYRLRLKKRIKLSKTNRSQNRSISVTMLNEMSRTEDLYGTIDIKPRNWFTNLKSVNPINMRYANFIGNFQNEQIFKQFLSDLNPIKVEQWREASLLMKAYLIFRSPGLIAVTIIFPTVDLTEQRHSWSKLLRCINIIVMPIICLLIFGKFLNYWIYAFPISCVLSVIVFFTSRTDVAPRYNILFAFICLFGLTVFMFYIQAEFTGVLSTFSTILNISPETARTTVMAWSNCVSHFIICYKLTKRGYYRLAWAGLYGSSNFVLLIGLGTLFIIKSNVTTETNDARGGSMGPTTAIYSICVVILTMLSILMTKLMARKSIAVSLFFMYFVYLIYIILDELALIHPYGSDHVLD